MDREMSFLLKVVQFRQRLFQQQQQQLLQQQLRLVPQRPPHQHQQRQLQRHLRLPQLVRSVLYV